MRQFIKQFAGGHDIGTDGCAHIQAGLVETYRRIVAYGGLQAAWEATFTAFSSAGWGSGGVDANDLDFLRTVQGTIADALSA